MPFNPHDFAGRHLVCSREAYELAKNSSNLSLRELFDTLYGMARPCLVPRTTGLNPPIPAEVRQVLVLETRGNYPVTTSLSWRTQVQYRLLYLNNAGVVADILLP